MVINLRSRKLLRLFNNVLEHIPNAKDKALLSKRIMLVTDNIDFIPIGTKPKWGAVISLKFRRTRGIVFLSPRRLPSQSDSFVRYVIAHNLAHVVLGHLEKINEEERHEEFEREADRRVKQWGFFKAL